MGKAPRRPLKHLRRYECGKSVCDLQAVMPGVYVSVIAVSSGVVYRITVQIARLSTTICTISPEVEVDPTRWMCKLYVQLITTRIEQCVKICFCCQKNVDCQLGPNYGVKYGIDSNIHIIAYYYRMNRIFPSFEVCTVPYGFYYTYSQFTRNVIRVYLKLLLKLLFYPVKASLFKT